MVVEPQDPGNLHTVREPITLDGDSHDYSDATPTTTLEVQVVQVKTKQKLAL